MKTCPIVVDNIEPKVNVEAKNKKSIKVKKLSASEEVQQVAKTTCPIVIKNDVQEEDISLKTDSSSQAATAAAKKKSRSKKQREKRREAAKQNDQELATPEVVVAAKPTANENATAPSTTAPTPPKPKDKKKKAKVENNKVPRTCLFCVSLSFCLHLFP